MKRSDFWAIAFGFVLLAGPAAADTYPSRPIRLIARYPAGVSTDIMARALQKPMAKILGQMQRARYRLQRSFEKRIAQILARQEAGFFKSPLQNQIERTLAMLEGNVST